MNNDRRKKLAAAQSKIEELISEIESIRDEEREAFDNLPESLQDSERGHVSQTAIDEIENALSDLETAMQYVGEAQA